LAEELGWHVVGATWNTKNSPSGEPDLRLVRERVIWMELKTEKGRLTSRQRFVVSRLKEAGAEVNVSGPGIGKLL
jgi:hypothetical protein